MVYLNEHEQWEAIKNWWKDNGKSTLTIVVVVLALSLGYSTWKHYQLRQRGNAAILYEQLQAGLQQDPSGRVVDDIANDLTQNYAHTPYASLAAFFAAKNEVNKNDLAMAEQRLQWVVTHSKTPTLRQIARLRWARVLLATQKNDQALVVLQTIDDATYLPAIRLVQGDIYLAQGQAPKARQSYVTALQSLSETSPMYDYLQKQIAQLPGEVVASSTSR